LVIVELAGTATTPPATQIFRDNHVDGIGAGTTLTLVGTLQGIAGPALGAVHLAA